MAAGRTFTGTPGQPSTSTGGPLELSADLDALFTAINELIEDKLGMSVAEDGSVDDTTKTIIYLLELASTTAGSSGASKVGYNGPVPSSATIKAAVDYIWGLGITGSSVPSDNSVSTLKIQDEAVTTAKLEDEAVTNAKLATDVKLGSLASLLTVLKDNYTNALNEVFNRALTQSNPIEPDSVVSQAITVTTPLSTVQKFTLDITSDIKGGAITITRDGGSSKPLEEPDGSAVTSLDIGIYDIVEKAGEFVLMGSQSFKGYEDVLQGAIFSTSQDTIVGQGTLIAVMPNGSVGSAFASANISELTIDGGSDIIVSGQILSDGGSYGAGWGASLPLPLRFRTGFTITGTNITYYYRLD